MPLLEAQQIFIERYVNSKGDLLKVLGSLGLDLHHLVMWRNSEEFDQEFRKANISIVNLLKHENYILGLRRVNEALNNQNYEQTNTQSRKIDAEGNLTFETKRVIKSVLIPSWAIKAALNDSTLVQAIHILVAEGVIPNAIAKKLLATAEQITRQMQTTFDANEIQEAFTEQRAIALIKQAILGTTEEIQ